MSEKYFGWVPTDHDGSEIETSPITYAAGDCKVEHLGEIKLADGRVFRGAIVTFPVSPPKLPISVVWSGTPVIMSVKL